jgi:tight adherence protein B
VATVSALPSFLAPYLPANPGLLALRLLEAFIATAGAALVILVLMRPGQAPDLGRLLRDMELQLAYVDWQHRAEHRWHARVRARIHRRLARAGLAHARPVHLALATLACGVLLLSVAWALLPSAPFAALGLLGGLALPWTWLGARAARRWRVIEAQVAEMLSVMSSAAATGATPQQALLEVLAQNVADPLAGHLRRALRDLDPGGLTDRSFLQVIAGLDAALASPSFHLAARAITASVRLGVPLGKALARSTGTAREKMAGRAEVRADFAYLRAAAGLVFSLPLVLTLVLHWLLPGAVEAAYSGPIGWGMAGGLGGWCLVGYRIVTGGERKSAARLELGGGGT